MTWSTLTRHKTQATGYKPANVGFFLTVWQIFPEAFNIYKARDPWIIGTSFDRQFGASQMSCLTIRILQRLQLVSLLFAFVGKTENRAEIFEILSMALFYSPPRRISKIKHLGTDLCIMTYLRVRRSRFTGAVAIALHVLRKEAF